MDNTPNVAMVTITAEEYFNLRMKADQTAYLTDLLMRVEGNYAGLFERVSNVENALHKKGVL